jgi:arsenate reductase-like glutaredoxin family protein
MHSSTYIEKYLQSCKTYLNAQQWVEMHNAPIEELDVTLDKLCESHLIQRRWIRIYQGKTHVVHG